MLQLSAIYYDRDVLSLRTGGPIGHAMSPVIDPTTLKIEGWYATARASKDAMIVPAGEVRDIIRKGIVVNDHTSLTHVEDLVRLKNIIELQFEIIGKKVISDSKRKIGKIADYAVDDSSMYIKKLYVNQNLLKNFTSQQLIIDRSQITEINDKYVVVRESTQKSQVSDRAPAAA